MTALMQAEHSPKNFGHNAYKQINIGLKRSSSADRWCLSPILCTTWINKDGADMEGIPTEAAVAYSKILFWHMPANTDESYETPVRTVCLNVKNLSKLSA